MAGAASAGGFPAMAGKVPFLMHGLPQPQVVASDLPDVAAQWFGFGAKHVDQR